jgi:hypothetical protein
LDAKGDYCPTVLLNISPTRNVSKISTSWEDQRRERRREIDGGEGGASGGTTEQRMKNWQPDETRSELMSRCLSEEGLNFTKRMAMSGTIMSSIWGLHNDCRGSSAGRATD